jgi:hypothetical protein
VYLNRSSHFGLSGTVGIYPSRHRVGGAVLARNRRLPVSERPTGNNTPVL